MKHCAEEILRERERENERKKAKTSKARAYFWQNISELIQNFCSLFIAVQDRFIKSIGILNSRKKMTFQVRIYAEWRIWMVPYFNSGTQKNIILDYHNLTEIRTNRINEGLLEHNSNASVQKSIELYVMRHMHFLIKPYISHRKPSTSTSTYIKHPS